MTFYTIFWENIWWFNTEMVILAFERFQKPLLKKWTFRVTNHLVILLFCFGYFVIEYNFRYGSWSWVNNWQKFGIDVQGERGRGNVVTRKGVFRLSCKSEKRRTGQQIVIDKRWVSKEGRLECKSFILRAKIPYTSEWLIGKNFCF